MQNTIRLGLSLSVAALAMLSSTARAQGGDAVVKPPVKAKTAAAASARRAPASAGGRTALAPRPKSAAAGSRISVRGPALPAKAARKALPVKPRQPHGSQD